MSSVSNNEADIMLSYKVHSFYDVVRGCGIDGVAHIIPKRTRPRRRRPWITALVGKERRHDRG